MASNSKAVAENIGGTGEAAVQQNEKQIDNDYTIPAEFNAVMAGPVTLATNATFLSFTACDKSGIPKVRNCC